jgi:hypothetical protein
MSVCLSRAISPRRSEFESQRAVFISFPGPASLSSALVAVEASPFLSQTMLLVVVRRLPGLLSLGCIFSQTARSSLNYASIRVDLTQLVRTSTQREHQVKRRAALEGVFFRGLVVGPTVQKDLRSAS